MAFLLSLAFVVLLILMVLLLLFKLRPKQNMNAHPPVQVKFVGGAQEKYNSLQHLAIAAMDMYSPKWKNYNRPKSYMFPPVYSYGRPEMSDQLIEDLEKKAQEQKGTTDKSNGSTSTSRKERKALNKETRQQERSINKAHETCSTNQKKSKNLKKSNQVQKGSTAAADGSSSTSQKEKKGLKQNNQVQDRSTTASEGSGLKCQKERKDCKNQCQQQGASTDESNGNCSGSNSQNLTSLPEPININGIAGLRIGDKAEHIVYNALESLSHLPSISPMVIINNFNLDRVKVSDKIFQNQEKLSVEYDFVIIGPKVGIVVIEVKNSDSKANCDKGLRQLRSFEKVIDFLKREYPEVDFPPEYLVRKLLILVNSTKSSQKKPRIDHGNQQTLDMNYEAPMDMERKPEEQEIFLPESGEKSSCSTDQNPDSLPKTIKKFIKHLVKQVKKIVKANHNDTQDKIRIWDQSDSNNRIYHISKPAFYSKLYDFFHEIGFCIRKDAYESFAPTIVGLASFITFKHSSNSIDLRLDLLKISEAAVLTVDSVRLQSHNPNPKVVTAKTKTELKTVRNFNLVLIPTPDQQRALGSPFPRQFIIGVAGTGKTVVLQQKALKMLQEGKRVLILTASSYKEEFKNFLEFNCRKIDIENFTVDCWSRETKFLKKVFMMGRFLSYYLAYLSSRSAMENRLTIDAVLFIKNWVEDDQFKTNRFFDNFDGILIDDACDQVDDCGEHISTNYSYTRFSRFVNLCAAVTFIYAIKMNHPSKTVWTALDLVLPPLGTNFFNPNTKERWLHALVMDRLLSNSTDQIPEYPFATVLLNQIMRNSENIFRFTYTTDVLLQLRLRPVMGHKIVGKLVTKLISPLLTSLYENKCDKKCETTWFEVKKVLDQIRHDKIPLNLVCILVGGEEFDREPLLKSFKMKCIESSIPTTSTGTMKTENEALHSNPLDRSKATETASTEALFLDYWFNVSSREWPVVIFCTITDKSTWKDGHAIQRYRAFSRATVKLYEVSLRYPSPNEESSRVPISRDMESLILFTFGMYNIPYDEEVPVKHGLHSYSPETFSHCDF